MKSEVKKVGRPVSDKPKEFRLHLRLDKQTSDKFENLCKVKNLNKSDLFRYLVNKEK